MDIHKFLGSKALLWTLVGILEVIIVLGAFRLGTSVGFHRATFAYHWGKNYERNFGPMRELEPMGQFNPHGTAGEVLRKEGNALIVKGSDNVEKVIITSTSTAIREDGHTLTFNDISSNAHIVVIGAPNDNGQIDARFIRVFPDKE